MTAVQLDSSGNPGQSQAIKGGTAVVVPVTIADGTVGSLSPASVTFNAGVDSSVQTQFTAANKAASTTITATEPSGFTSPPGSAAAGNWPGIQGSPAEYLVALEGVAGLASQLRSMGEEITCHSREIVRRRCPEDVGQALSIRAGEPVSMVRMMWTAGGDPAGLTTTYLADPDTAFTESAEPKGTPALTISLLAPPTNHITADANAYSALRPGSLFIEVQPPPTSVARKLRLSAGEPVVLIVVRFDYPGRQRPAALTIAALRPDKFRIRVQSPDLPLAEGQDVIEPA